MFKNSKGIAISKRFLIPLLFVVLIFTSIGMNIDDVCAHDLNQSVSGIESGLNVEDKLENSQENVLTSNMENSKIVGKSNDDDILTRSISLNGGTFEDIRNAIRDANAGDTIKLSGTFNAEKAFDQIRISKELHFTSDTQATLNGKGLTHIFVVDGDAEGSSFKNLKLINGYRTSVGAAMHIYAKNVVVKNCVFENNQAVHGGAIYTSYTALGAENLRIENCRFIKNYAIKNAGAVGAYSNNTKILNCTFDSNYVYNPIDEYIPYGGALQVGLDDVVSIALVKDCKFLNNHVDSNGSDAHGGAGCVRDGTSYVNCLFVNNSAAQGGALTFHASGLIKNCTFYNNSALLYGGALSTGFLYDGIMNLKVEDSVFEGNTAPLGGAVQLIGKNIQIKDSTFNNNYASENGGAVNIEAETVSVFTSSFNDNVANVDGGAIFINGKTTLIKDSSFISNDALPDINKLDDGLGGAIYINSTQADVENNQFYYNTARNGSAIYYGKEGRDLKLVNNTLYQNQAWVYRLPIYAEDIYYGQTENISSIIHGGNNIAKYGDLAVSNAIYNAAESRFLEIDGETPVYGATTSGHLYQDDREYNMNILLTVKYQDGSVVYNKTLNSDTFGEVKDSLNNLKAGKYYVTATHFEDTYYKGITNTTSFIVTDQVDNKIKKLSKSSSNDDEINYGDVVIWTLNITNNGPSNATNVVVRDILPDGLVYIEDDRNGAYDPVTGTLNIPFLEVGEVYIINIKTSVKKTGEIVNNANVTSKEYDYDLTNNHDDSKINVNPACDLAVSKTANVTTLNLGELVKWTVTVRNNGPDVATGVVVSDVLPRSLIWVSDSGSGSYNHNTGAWNIGNLNKGASKTLTITTRVNATGTIVNSVSVSGNEFDIDESNNHANKSVNVKSACDLGIVKLVNPSVVNYTGVVKWTLVVTNYGPDAASGVKISDALPGGFVYINSTVPYVNGEFYIGNLAVGRSVSVDVYTRANITGTFVNVASVKGNEYDQNPNNNRAEKSVTVKPASDLAIDKSVDIKSPNFGDLVKWTVTVRNNGPDVATGVVVSDVLPRSLIWVSDSGAGSYNHNTGVWNVGSLNKGASKTLTITTRVNATGSIVNLVSGTGNEFDVDKSNNQANETVNVPKASDLGIVKLVNPSVVNYTDVVKWTLVVSNYGPDAASGVRISDALPSGFVYINSTVPYVNGEFYIGNLAVGRSVSVDVYTRANITGTFVNVASVKGNEYDQNPKNNHANISVTVMPASDLIVVKRVSESNPNFLDLVKWTLTVTNNGPDGATGVVVSDVLPRSLIWVSDSGAGSYNHNTGVWNVGSINNGASKTLTITTRVNGTGVFVNNVSVTGNEFDWNKSNNRGNETINVSKAADLEVIKLANQSFVNYRQFIKWTIIVTNNGPDKATGVTVDDILPEGLELVEYNATKGFYDNGIWVVCCLEKGETQSLDLICFVNKTGVLTNNAVINGTEYDHNQSNNYAEASVAVPKSSDLSVIKTVDNDYPDFGDIIRWSIVVTNNGPDDADDIYVMDLIPEGLILLDATCTAGNYYEDMWAIDRLDNGCSETLILRCLVKTLADRTNTAEVMPSQYDWNESNNKDSASISVNPIADVAITKLINVTQANYLDLIKWTLLVNNYGPNDASNVMVSDVIPNGLEVVSVIGGEFEDSIWDIGDLANGEYRKLEIICKIKATGSFKNFANVWGSETDPDLYNNDDQCDLYVPPASDLSITKTVSKYSYSVGDVVKYSVKLLNKGPDRAENLEVKEVMDDNLLLKSFYASAGDFDKVNDVWSLDLLDAGESAYLTLQAIAQKAGTAKNKVSASSDNYDPDLSNNDDSVSINISKKDEPEKNAYKIPNNHSNSELKEYSDSILEKHVSGNPFMVLVLLFVFTLGAVYGKNILKKR